MKRIIAQARKELTQFSRDRLTLALALVLPLILLVLYGRAIAFSVTGVAIFVEDYDATPRSRAYIETLAASRTFRIVALPTGMRTADALAAEAVRAVVTIPTHFERDLARGRDVDVQWLIDATDANTANILRGDAAAMTQAFVAQNSASAKPSIKIETRLWYNPGRESDKYIGPGVIAVVLALFPPLLAALAMSRENEQKTILQVYVSSISAREYLLGKTLAFLVVALAEWAVLLALGLWFFGLWFIGDPLPFLVGTLIYLFCNVAFGVMAGAAMPNQAMTIQAVATVSFVFSFLLSGFMFPLSNIPAGLRWIANIVPARYFIEIARDAFVRGSGWSAIWQSLVSLALLGTFFLFVAWRKMRKMQVEI
ncbi:MAG: ABC transporter permease [Acidobacteria bacterium]|nr:ABC transporter permease [Acidobacteriota bacterium]